MGSFVSQPLEPVKFVAPPETTSTPKPAQVTAPGAPASPAQAPLFNNCWSCRVLSGSGLIGAGGYVYWMARKPMKLGYPPGPGTIAQMIFGISESLGTTLGPGEREREKRRSEIRHVGRGGAGGEAPGLVTWPQASPPVRRAGREEVVAGILSLLCFFLNNTIYIYVCVCVCVCIYIFFFF